jgi:hypothetical protein
MSHFCFGLVPFHEVKKALLERNDCEWSEQVASDKKLIVYIRSEMAPPFPLQVQIEFELEFTLAS